VDAVGPGGGGISLAVSGNFSAVDAFLKDLESDYSGIVIDTARLSGQGNNAFVSISATVTSGKFAPISAEPLERQSPFRQ